MNGEVYSYRVGDIFGSGNNESNIIGFQTAIDLWKMSNVLETVKMFSSFCRLIATIVFYKRQKSMPRKLLQN